MVALPLFDLVLSAPNAEARSLDFASQMIRSSLFDLEQIRLADAALMPVESSGPFDRQAATLVRGMYEEWARQAEALIERLQRLERRGHPVEGLPGFMDAYGSIRAMLSVSLDDFEQGLRDIAEGRTTPLEEVRRELRLRAH